MLTLKPLKASTLETLLIIFLVIPCFSQNTEQEYFYRVRQKDNISIILFKLGLSPIYGSKGSLKKTLELNSRTAKDKNLVFPGDIIKLELSEGDVENVCHKVLNKNEIVQTFDEACHKSIAKNINKPLPDAQRNYASTEESPTEPPVEAPQVKLAPPVVYSEFTLALKSGYSSLSGNDHSNNTQGELLSKLGFGYEFNWIQFWNKKLSTNIGSSGKEIDFEDTDDSKIILNKENFVYQFDFGITYKLYPRLAGSIETAFGQTPLYRGAGANTYRVDILQRSGLGLRLDYELLNNGPLTLTTYAQTGILKFAKDAFYDPGDGSYFGYGVSINHRRSNYGLTGTLGYWSEKADIRDVSYTTEHLDFILGLVWTWSE